MRPHKKHRRRHRQVRRIEESPLFAERLRERLRAADDLAYNAQKEVAILRATVTELQHWNHKLECDGLHRHCFLPVTSDKRGTVRVEVQTRHVRESFTTAVELRVSDHERQWTQQQTDPRVFELLARHLIANVIQQLRERFGR